MGLWGAAQAIAFAIGGFAGAAASDLTRELLDSPGTAYGLVFAAEASLFIVAAVLAARLGAPPLATRIAPSALPQGVPLASQERPA
jgi:BCD family chlorophyll transporter-like MFS transporter